VASILATRIVPLLWETTQNYDARPENGLCFSHTARRQHLFPASSFSVASQFSRTLRVLTVAPADSPCTPIFARTTPFLLCFNF
jgi:hypothetical protein